MNLSIQINDQIDNSNFFKAVTKLSDYTDYIIKGIRFLLGAMGLIITIPLFTILSVLLFVLTFTLKWQLKAAIKTFYNQVSSLSQIELIENHLYVEKLRDVFLSIQKGGPKESLSFLFMPFLNQISQINHLLREAESTLRNAAYPDLGKPLTSEHISELRTKLSGVNDWEDEGLDIYEKVYC